MDKTLTIVGGGITGLAAAYLAASAGVKVRVLEAGKSFGGLLNTFSTGGNRLEKFYHHHFTHDAELHWLLKEVGLEKNLVFHESSMGVFRNGKIYPFNTPFDLLRFKPLPLWDKLLFGLSSLYLGKRADWKQSEGIAAMNWFYRYAGRKTTEALWKPLLEIKFGPYAREVPLSWMIGRLRQRMGSRKKGDEKLGYMHGSLQVLLDALLVHLKGMGVELLNETRVEQLFVHGDSLDGIRTNHEEFFGGEYLFTIPTVNMLPMVAPLHTGLYEQLAAIRYFGAVCVVLEMDRPLSSIYWLNVADEGFPFGGIIEHTNLISPEEYGGLHLAYLSRYFAWEEPLAQMGKQEIADLMIGHLDRINPRFVPGWIKKVHVFKTMTAATVCGQHFSQQVPACQTPLRHLYLANMAHVYPDERSINNSIRVAGQACRVMGMQKSDVPTQTSLAGYIGF
jgi:protoporphyrinogen oxidase